MTTTKKQGAKSYGLRPLLFYLNMLFNISVVTLRVAVEAAFPRIEPVVLFLEERFLLEEPVMVFPT